MIRTILVHAVFIVARLQIPFSGGVALAVMNVDSDDDVGVGVLTTGTFDNGGASVTGGQAADEDEARPRGRKGKGRGKGRGNGLGGRGNGSFPPEQPAKPMRPMTDKVCCYKCGGLGHVARTKCEDGSWLLCASREQIDHSILNAIKYPHIPGAEERRAAAKAATAKAAQAEMEPEQTEEEPENDEDADAQYAGTEAGDEYAEY